MVVVVVMGLMVVVVVMGLMVKGTRILVVDPPKS